MNDKKLLIQCDFDGTITEKDVSIFLLDDFAEGDWRKHLADYKSGRISVNMLNIKAFAMVKAGKERLLKATMEKSKIRPGFKELIEYCRKRDIRFVIASNGMDFYIDAILKKLGISDIEVFAAQTTFTQSGIDARYIGPQGNVMTDDFKDSIVRHFKDSRYDVLYAGNGTSDICPAEMCSHIFATSELLDYCKKQTGLSYTAFADCYDIINGLEMLQG